MATRTLEQRLERAEAYIAVNNLIGRYGFYMNGQQWARIPELFAQKTPGVTSEVTSNGVYKGIEQVRKLWGGFLAGPRMLAEGATEAEKERYRKERDRIGRLTVHQFTTPVIEVAGDAKTARGVWMSPGQSSMRDEKGDLQAYWLFGKIEADFVKEDGEWKFWHHHAYITIRTKFEESWVKSAEAGKKWYPGAHDKMHSRDDFPADAPTTYHRMYDPETALDMVPAPPEQYETYKGD